MDSNIRSYPLSIVMLGARRVGKTTLLAVTWDKFKKGEFNETTLKLIAELSTQRELDKRLIKLRTLPPQIDEIVQDRDYGIDPNRLDAEAIAYKFTLTSDTDYIIRKQPAIDLSFIDYSGEFLLERGEEVERLLSQARVTIVAVDCVALMESKRENWGWLHEQHNIPNLIASYLRKSLKDVKETHLVLFVPVRCEEYLHKDESGGQIRKEIKKGFKEAFEVLSEYRKLVSCAILPVQTIGTLYFDDIVSKTPSENSAPHNYAYSFRKKSVTDVYSPKDTDQILLHWEPKWSCPYVVASQPPETV